MSPTPERLCRPLVGLAPPVVLRAAAAGVGWGVLVLLASMVLSALAGLLEPAQAATYWVSQTGNSANSGIDSTANAKTLAWALSSTPAGDTVRFKSGTYSTRWEPTINGTSTSARTVFLGFPQDPSAVIVNGIDFDDQDFIELRWVHTNGDFDGFSNGARGNIWRSGRVLDQTSGFGHMGDDCKVDSIQFLDISQTGSGQPGFIYSYSTGGDRNSNNETTNCTFVGVIDCSCDFQFWKLNASQYGKFSFNTVDLDFGVTGYGFFSAMYYSYYNQFQGNDITINYTTSISSDGFIMMRDSSRYNRFWDNTFTFTGTGQDNGAGWTNSGAVGATRSNYFGSNVWKGSNHQFGIQNGLRGDTLEFNVIINNGGKAIVDLGSTGQDLDTVLVRHNTFYGTTNPVVDFTSMTASGSGSKFVANLVYSTAANGSQGVVSVPTSSGILDSAGTVFSRGGTASAGFKYNGTTGTPGSGGNYGASGKAVWGSPVFVDSTYATFDAGISQTGYADNIKAPSLQDGFSGAFSDSIGGSTGTSDADAPSAVSDLAIAGESQTAFDLEWTSPDDDGTGSGAAALYDIRYSTSTINEGNWASATPLTGEPTPQDFDNLESWTTGDVFSPATTYYLALKSQDEAGNWSALSNVVSGATDAVPDTVVALSIVTKDDVAGITFDVDFDADTNSTVRVFYGIGAATDTAHAPARRPGSARTYATSLFGLTPATTYTLAIVTSDGARQETTFTTRPYQWWRRYQTGPSVYVSPTGSSGNTGLTQGSPKATIAQAWTVLLAQPNQGRGGAVVLMDGTHYLRTDISGSSGTPDTGYIIKALNPGSAIIDGADERIVNGSSTLTWTAVNAAADPARVGGAYATGDTLFRAHYAAADSLEGLAEGGYKYHHCASLAEIWNKTGTGSAGAYDLSATTVGFVHINASADSVYMRPRGGTQARTSTKAFGYRHSLLWITDPYVQVEGIVFRNAGGLPTLNGKAVRFGGGGASGNNGTVFNCTFESNDMEGVYGINAFGGADSLAVASCTFSAGYTERFGYVAGKGRREEYRQLTQLDGRYNTIEGNTVRYAFNGIGQAGIAGSLTAGADLDVTGNTVSDVSDDALELEVGCGVNQRIVGNQLSRFGNGLSQTPVVIGPSFVVRNLFRYPKSGGGAFKLGAGSTAQGFYYHNTTAIDTTRASAGAYAPGGQFWHKTFVNNVLTGKLGTWPGVRSTLTGADTTGAITNAFNWNVVYAASDTIAYWKNAALDTAGWKLRGQEHNGRMRYHPAWQDTANGYWCATRGIDGGRRIAGITTALLPFTGAAPDMGAFEVDQTIGGGGAAVSSAARHRGLGALRSRSRPRLR